MLDCLQLHPDILLLVAILSAFGDSISILFSVFAEIHMWHIGNEQTIMAWWNCIWRCTEHHITYFVNLHCFPNRFTLLEVLSGLRSYCSSVLHGHHNPNSVNPSRGPEKQLWGSARSLVLWNLMLLDLAEYLIRFFSVFGRKFYSWKQLQCIKTKAFAISTKPMNEIWACSCIILQFSHNPRVAKRF